MPDGSGLGSAIPRLTPSKIESYDLDLACLIREGIPDATYTPMPANPDLSSAEITNLINFLRSQFANDDRFADPRKVEEVLMSCQ